VLHILLADEGRTFGDWRSADRGDMPRHWGILARAVAEQGPGLRGCAEDGEKVLLRWECSAAAVLSLFCFTYCVGSKRGGLAGADAGREPQGLERARKPVLVRVTSEAARPKLCYSSATDFLSHGELQ
jgi:hypothetical protein